MNADLLMIINDEGLKRRLKPDNMSGSQYERLVIKSYNSIRKNKFNSNVLKCDLSLRIKVFCILSKIYSM